MRGTPVLPHYRPSATIDCACACSVPPWPPNSSTFGGPSPDGPTDGPYLSEMDIAKLPMQRSGGDVRVSVGVGLYEGGNQLLSHHQGGVCYSKPKLEARAKHGGVPCTKDPLDPLCNLACVHGEMTVCLDVSGQVLSGQCPDLVGWAIPRMVYRGPGTRIWFGSGAGGGHEATETGFAYAPVSQAHGHNHIGAGGGGGVGKGVDTFGSMGGGGAVAAAKAHWWCLW